MDFKMAVLCRVIYSGCSPGKGWGGGEITGAHEAHGSFRWKKKCSYADTHVYLLPAIPLMNKTGRGVFQ